MYMWICSLCFCFASFALHADDGSSSTKQQQAQAAIQQLIQVDEQIENLIKQKVQLKEEIAAHSERAETGILPGVERRQRREIGDLMQEMQTINQQIMALEEKRSQILLALD